MLTLYKKYPFGLDISDHSIEALSLRKRRDKITLDAYNRFTIPSGIIVNGIIAKPENLLPYLRKINAQSMARSFGINQCLIILPQSQTYAHLISLPADLSLFQLEAAVRQKVKSIIPLAIDDLMYRYFKVGKDNDVSKEKIFIVAVAKAIFESYLDVLRRANLRPLAVGVEFLNQARSLLRNYQFKEKETVLVIDSGYEITNFNFFKAEGAQYIGESKIAGRKIIELMMEEMSLNRESAEIEKKRRGISKIAKNAKLRKLINQLIADIKEAIDYFQQTSQSRVAKIILTGGNSLIAGLPEFLSTVLHISTELGDPFFGIVKDEKILNRETVLYSNVVGLALRGFYWGKAVEENDVNFLEDEAPLKQQNVSV